MRIEGSIHPLDGAIGFTREAWCRLVATRPEFRRPAAREGQNPMDGGFLIVQPPLDVAEVLLDGKPVGHAYWSMSEEPLVNISVETSAMPWLQSGRRRLVARITVVKHISSRNPNRVHVL